MCVHKNSLSFCVLLIILTFRTATNFFCSFFFFHRANICPTFLYWHLLVPTVLLVYMCTKKKSMLFCLCLCVFDFYFVHRYLTACTIVITIIHIPEQLEHITRSSLLSFCQLMRGGSNHFIRCDLTFLIIFFFLFILSLF